MYEIFVQLCKSKGITTYKVCKDLGISQGTISNWKNRGNNLSTAILKKIADYFEVSIEYLINGEDVKWDPAGQTMDYTISLSEEEEDLLMKYRKADNTQKEMIRRILAYSDKM